MSDCKISYSIKWEDQFWWLRKAKEPDSAICSLCNKTFRIDGGGLAQVKSHQESKSHREKESIDPNQRTFVIGAKKSITLSSDKLSLTTEEIIQRTEIVQALKFVDSNYSFSSACDESDSFRVMCPDSDIAKNNHQGATEIKITSNLG